MPMTRFVCPDGEQTKIASCYEKCRMGLRCATLPALLSIGKQRSWTGTPSTTQLIKGTREAFLEITKEYAASPDSFAFAFVGTKAHARLERNAAINHLMEERLEEDGITGMFDLYGEEDGVHTLYDYKVSGSYKVAKTIGLKEEVDEVNTGEIYKSGERKGQPKTKKVSRIVQGEPDLGDWGLQLNHYRILIEKSGFPVDRIVLQAIVRDGGTYLAKKRGLSRNIYLIDVPRLADNAVVEFFHTKRDALKAALESGTVPEICTEDERWQDRKCAEYCRVAGFCDHGQAIHASQAVEEVA